MTNEEYRKFLCEVLAVGRDDFGLEEVTVGYKVRKGRSLEVGNQYHRRATTAGKKKEKKKTRTRCIRSTRKIRGSGA